MGVVTESQFHVLAVDDSFFDRKMIERLLQKSSCQVTTVDSGSKALEFLGLRESNQSDDPNATSTSPEVEINLIITDYCMPGMTGYDLLKRVKQSAAFRSIPVVIMSSENIPARISRCLEEGAEEFFLKPVKLADLTKLKPHMMKTKLKKESENPAEEVEPEIEEEEESPVIEILTLHQELESEQQEPMLTNNKRKAMEEVISTEFVRLFVGMLLLMLLNRVGYSPNISHRELVEMAEHRKELEKMTKPVVDTLRSYQDLPPDKALAALAIEDKKRQFAAAEKYLEEVLQSALETSDE
ncbi:hypothetical protein DY000_02002309 [Brassica cretica]|uniref:Response regulatory domain-containing protein n=1 Tax=Brassica cretica TaxID=69181 RepID=A0ABQ7BSC9_BRACR|nr:hypothetical protein DY000_02002309 [Brassica cretica]